VLLAEADAPTRAGLRLSLTSTGFEVVAEARARAEAVDAAVVARPDVALISAGLPGGGLSTVGTVAERLPATKVVVLSSRPSGEELVAAVVAGACGYLGADMSPDRLPHALRGVLEGEMAIPRRHTWHLIEELRGREAARAVVAARTGYQLTDRQWEVLHLLATETTTAVMAYRLGISEVTVRRHVSSVLTKLGVGDRAAAVELLQRRSSN
jgi:DNA-binding NarL/FixJ family response regulator